MREYLSAGQLSIKWDVLLIYGVSIVSIILLLMLA